MSLSTFSQGCLDLLLESLTHVPVVALGLGEVEDFWDFVELEVAGDEGILAVHAHSSVLVVKLDKGGGSQVERRFFVEHQSDLVEEGSDWLNLAVLLQDFLS